MEIIPYLDIACKLKMGWNNKAATILCCRLGCKFGIFVSDYFFLANQKIQTTTAIKPMIRKRLGLEFRAVPVVEVSSIPRMGEMITAVTSIARIPMAAMN